MDGRRPDIAKWSGYPSIAAAPINPGIDVMCNGGSADDRSDRLADIDAIAVRVLEDKGSEPIVFVLDGFDDAQAIALTNGMQRVGIVDHHVGDVEGSRLVVGLQREMHLGFVPLQDHEADGIAVLERLRKAEYLRIEVVGLYDIFHWEHSGNSPEANAVIGGVVHRITSC